jgi:hypothetical protein
MIESKLWQIPLSAAAYADKVPTVVEDPDIGKLYELYEFYIDHLKAQSRKGR